MDDSDVDAEDEISTDSSGNGNDGTLYGDDGVDDNGSGLDCTATGKFGTGCELDGTDDYVDMGSFTGVDQIDTITYSVWISPDFIQTEGSDGYVLDIGSESRIFFKATLDDFRFTMSTSDGQVGADTTGLTWTADTWHHIVGTYDGTIAKVYWDGELNNSSPGTGTIDAVGIYSTYIGARSDDSNYWDGTIDNVRIYNRTLSPKEVQALYSWAPGPVAHYKFDENTGTTSTYDSSGNGNTGTMNGSMTEADWIRGKHGSALEFDGSDDYISVADSTSLDITGKLTITTWLNPSSLSSYRFIMEKGEDDTDAYAFTTNGDELYFEWTPPGQSLQSKQTTAANLVVENWYHVAVVFDYPSDSIKFYLDGFENYSTSVTYDLRTTGDDLWIGKQNYLPSHPNHWIGQLDDIRIYNYARTQEQIVQDMNAGHPAPGSPIGSPVLWLKFDKGYTDGSGAEDSSPRGNVTSMTGAAWTNDGKFGKGWDGNGTNYSVCFPDDDYDFTGTDSFTIATWFRSDDAANPGAVETIYDKVNGANNDGFRLYAETDGDIVFGIDDDAVSFPEDTVGNLGNDYYDGTWHHIVAVKTSNTKLEMYIDGELYDSNASLSATGTLVAGQGLVLGDTDAVDNGDELNGDLDEFKIYRFALTADQVRIEYNQGSATTLGAVTTNPTTEAVSNSYADSFCVPGDTTTCSSPVVDWKLDKNTGTSDAYDSSGNDKDGDYTNIAETDWVRGKYGSALHFDGTNHIRNTDDADLDFAAADNFAVAAWIKHDPISSSADYILNKADATTGGYELYMDASGNICFDIDDDSSWTPDDSACSSGTDYSDSAWHHVVGAKTGTTKIEVFVDGILKNTDDTIAATNTLANGGHTYVAVHRSNSLRWVGEIDEVQIFDTAATQARVAWLYNKGKPVGHWKFDECQGTTAYDSSENGNNGTITEGGSGGNDGGVGTCSSGNGDEMWDNGTTGKRNASLNFDGTDDYVNIGSSDPNSTLDLTERLTLSTWVKSDDTGDVTNSDIINRDDGSSKRQYNIHITNDGDGGFAKAYLNGTTVTSITDINSGGSTWYHVAATWDKDVNSGKITLYINGVEENSGVKATALTSYTQEVHVGRRGSVYFDGQIDEVKIYNYALTEEQIKMDYAQGAVRFE
ncbi:LamG domain-containing protein [bacterium]|nr:LamG domain-containing protein [bacterium]